MNVCSVGRQAVNDLGVFHQRGCGDGWGGRSARHWLGNYFCLVSDSENPYVVIGCDCTALPAVKYFRRYFDGVAVVGVNMIGLCI